MAKCCNNPNRYEASFIDVDNDTVILEDVCTNCGAYCWDCKECPPIEHDDR